MSGTVTGVLVGALLALAALAFGFWGFLLVAVFAAIGGLVGAIVSGRLDVRAVIDAARGRRSA
jgi:uncharacterized membrane protein